MAVRAAWRSVAARGTREVWLAASEETPMRKMATNEVARDTRITTSRLGTSKGAQSSAMDAEDGPAQQHHASAIRGTCAPAQPEQRAHRCTNDNVSETSGNRNLGAAYAAPPDFLSGREPSVALQSLAPMPNEQRGCPRWR